MADVQPFRGLRYNVERIGDISSVISPPYDIISPEEQRSYHQQSPYNVVRLELGEDRPFDSPEDNRYTRAAGAFREWMREGVLFREPDPAFYILEHRFVHQGTLKRRWGLVGRVRLAEQGGTGARPHETVMESRVRDRLNLLHRCRVNVSSVMGMVYQDHDGLVSLLSRLAERQPDLGAIDHQQVIHNMWVVKDEESVARIISWCADKVVYIADGHHRYETALAYQRDQQVAICHATGQEAHNFVMMTLTDAGDPGTVALPAHRVLRLPEPEDMAAVRQKLDDLFDMEYLAPTGSTLSERLEAWLGILEERGKTGTAIGVYGLDGRRLCLLTPRERQKLDDILPSDRSQEWKSLDVAVLHWVVLHQILRVDNAQKEEEYLTYTQDGEDAMRQVDSGECQLAFLLNPVPISSVLAVADAGDKMPPKSTYFYPKLPTGLVMYPLWDNGP